MFDWDDIDEAIENDNEHAPYYVDPVWRSGDMTIGAKTIESVCELCAAEGYPYDKENCKDCEYNPNCKDETTTFEQSRRTLCFMDVYACSECERDVYLLASYQEHIFDYNYCPYCGKPVAKE